MQVLGQWMNEKYIAEFPKWEGTDFRSERAKFSAESRTDTLPAFADMSVREATGLMVSLRLELCTLTVTCQSGQYC